MSRLEAVVRGVWDFVVGDDWRIAVGVVAALALTGIAAGAAASAWWILPAATAMMLAVSVWRASRPGR